MVRFYPSLFCLLLALGGCQTAADPGQLALANHQQCVDYGFKPDTDAYANCRLQLDQTRAENDLRRRAALAAGMQSMGDAFDRNAAASRAAVQANRPINCVSVRAVDGSIHTECR